MLIRRNITLFGFRSQDLRDQLLINLRILRSLKRFLHHSLHTIKPTPKPQHHFHPMIITGCPILFRFLSSGRRVTCISNLTRSTHNPNPWTQRTFEATHMKSLPSDRLEVSNDLKDALQFLTFCTNSARHNSTVQYLTLDDREIRVQRRIYC